MERKNKKKTIALVCGNCGKSFIKEMKEYNRVLRNRKTRSKDFYCNKWCSQQRIQVDEFSPFRSFIFLSKKNSTTKKLKMDIDEKYLMELWKTQNGICPYTNIPMVLYPSSKKKKFTPDAASVDRIDQKEGYVRGNVRFVCLSINYARNRFDEDDFVEFMSKIKTGS